MKTSSFGLSSLLLASAYVAMASTGGVASASTITFNNPVASAGTTAGLETTVQYYVPTFGYVNSSGTYVGAGGYGCDAGGLATGNPSLTTLSNMESFLSTGSFTVPAANSNDGLATTFTQAASPSLSVTTAGNVLQTSNPYYPGYNANAEYAALAYNVDQQGYIDIATAGTYTFTISAADDAAEVYIGGNGTVGSGTSIAADGYEGPFPNSNTVTFTAAGLYNFELFYYQGFGGQDLTYTVTPPSGAAAPTYYVSAVPVPAPASIGLLGVGSLGLLLLRKRRHA